MCLVRNFKIFESVAKHTKDLKFGLQETFTQVPKFVCPTFSEINLVPKNCNQQNKKYPKAYNSDFFIIYPPYSPGPSEQTNGLKQVFMLTALLNKGLIISNFTTHKTDNLSKLSNIPFGLRVDMEHMCQFIHLTSAAEKYARIKESHPERLPLHTMTHHELVHGSGHASKYFYLDEILVIKDRHESKSLKYFETTNKKYLKNFTENPRVDLMLGKNIETDCISLPPFIFKHFPETLGEDVQEWFRKENLFYDLIDPKTNQTVDRSIGISHIYNWIFGQFYHLIDEGGAYRFKSPIKGLSAPPEIDQRQAANKYRMDLNLVKDSYLATTHPKFIKTWASIFIQKHLKCENNNFVSAHFRFNPEDFFGPNFLNQTIDLKIEKSGGLGHGLKSSMSFQIQQSLKNSSYFLEKLTATIGILTILDPNPPGVIYIASPINIAEIFPKNGTEFLNFKIFSTLDVLNFLKFYQDECWILQNYLGDVLSTLEKEILIKSKIFFRARPSNWSFNVQGHRFANYNFSEIKQDRVIFDVFG